MDVGGGKRLARVMFYIAAMLVCFGLGLHLMEMEPAGIILIIVGVALLVVSFSMLKFMMLLSLRQH